MVNGRESNSRVVLANCDCISLGQNVTLQRRLTGCPLPLGDIGSPSLPVSGAIAVLFEALLLFAEVLLILNENHRVCVCACVCRSDVGDVSLTGNKGDVLHGATGGVGLSFAGMEQVMRVIRQAGKIGWNGSNSGVVQMD